MLDKKGWEKDEKDQKDQKERVWSCTETSYIRLNPGCRRYCSTYTLR